MKRSHVCIIFVDKDSTSAASSIAASSTSDTSNDNDNAADHTSTQLSLVKNITNNQSDADAGVLAPQSKKAKRSSKLMVDGQSKSERVPPTIGKYCARLL